MDKSMQVAGMGESTREAYARSMRQVVEHFEKSWRIEQAYRAVIVYLSRYRPTLRGVDGINAQNNPTRRSCASAARVGGVTRIQAWKTRPRLPRKGVPKKRTINWTDDLHEMRRLLRLRQYFQRPGQSCIDWAKRLESITGNAFFADNTDRWAKADGVAKSTLKGINPIYCVVAGSRNVQHTICMPSLCPDGYFHDTATPGMYRTLLLSHLWYRF